jgi:Tfp pilus assembly protein PilF
LADAAAAFRAAIAVKSDYAEAHYALGTVLQQKNDLDGAIAAFREALKFAPNAAEIHNTLGNALRQKGDIGAARAEFQEAARLNQIRTNQQAANFATNTGLAQLKEGNLDAAVERFQAAIQLDPDNAQAHYQLAKALQQKGQREAAEAEYQKAKKINPRVKPLQ